MDIHKVTSPEDTERVISVLSSAFEGDPLIGYITRKDEKKDYAVRLLFEQLIPHCISSSANTYISNDRNAAAVWWKSTEDPFTLSFYFHVLWNIRTWLDITGSFYDMYNVYSFMSATGSKVPSFPHLYILYIGVDPTIKGKGLGSAMMRTITDYADKYNYPIYLDNSKEQNIRFYQKHGFVVLERLQLCNGTLCEWRMLRPMKDPTRPVGEELHNSSVFIKQ